MTTPDAAPTSNQLAVDRTRLAHDRTLMAWVRTSTSLISFGFTIYKFFQYLREKGAPERRLGPREFAMAMILIGLTGLALATIQHQRDMASLRRHVPDLPYSLATVIAALVALLGVGSFIIVILRK